MKYLLSFDSLNESLKKSYQFNYLLSKLKYWYNDKVANILLSKLVDKYKDDEDINVLEYDENNEVSFVPKLRRKTNSKSQTIKPGKLAKHILDSILPKLGLKKTFGGLHSITETVERSKYGKYVLIVPIDILGKDYSQWLDLFDMKELFPMTMRVTLEKKFLLKKNVTMKFTAIINKVVKESYLSKKKIYGATEVECLSFFFDTKDNISVTTSHTDTINGGRNLYVKFYDAELKLLLVTDNEIEKFSNRINALNESKHQLQEVSGEKIRYYYDERNSVKSDNTYGVRSCMSSDSNLKYLDLYVKNSDKVKLLILLNDEGKLLARALLWSLDYCSEPGVKYLMDRVYCAHPSQEEYFHQYAIDNNYLYIVNKNVIVHKNKRVDTAVRVELSEWNFGYYPYLDNLFYLEKNKGLLMNANAFFELEGEFIKLQSANGTYQNVPDVGW